MPEVMAVVLAAGHGKRMKSRLPKVLHRVGGRYMVQHVLEALKGAGVSESVLVVGHGAELVREALGPGYRYAVQAEQLGTGHAVLQAEPVIGEGCDTVMVVCGDTPLLSGETLRRLLLHHRESGAAATVLSAVFSDPTGYGRIIRNQAGELERIVEESDASAEVRRIAEGNTGTYCFSREHLFAALKELSPDNAQGEYYLPDVLPVMRRRQLKVVAAALAGEEEARGINSRQQLAEVGQIMRRRVLQRLMESGVTIVDPGTTYIDSTVEIDVDTVIHPFTFIEGETRIGSDCRIGPFTRIVGSRLGNGVEVLNSVILESELGDGCQIGPFAYLRPLTRLAAGVKVGDFVEIKKSQVGRGSKIPHLSYIGDATLGEEVNVGAGTITCNYDGEHKHLTVVEDGAFIGSNTNLVAPLRVGAHAVTGAGSTITKDVPPYALAVERSPQRNVSDWQKKVKRGRRREDE
ncbi:MAG: bifunctional UDP-N-acetylglucosamine diphosphorylase/glucosamine-1-phosphate N-acetyltransferase GlmU [Syntrophomonadaceae bacterium]|nr:bifunctional UDP-N-acetylglucosamine diphosphorylase/glucosamine-1-phosphate N-acetyltransferase GlmU [Syntrophomonadaceae bacterium]